MSSLKLLDQPCRTRPTIIAVDQWGFNPRHIELHRCQGTFQRYSLHPSQLRCVPIAAQYVTLALTSRYSNRRDKVVQMVNHTRCGYSCKAIYHCKYDEGERDDPDNCRCIIVQTGSTAQGQGSDNEKGLCA